MCELFAMSCNKEVNVKFSFTEFKRRGSKRPDGSGNPHGWGIGFYRNYRSITIKEPNPSYSSELAKFIRDNDFVRSKIVISHVRRKTNGEENMLNTHPFERILEDNGHSCNWIFAHNGDVTSMMGHPDFKLDKFRPIGETDSEYAFCYILEQLKVERPRDINDKIDIITKTVRRIDNKGSFNFIMSDSEHLYCYRGRKGNKLCYVNRDPGKDYSGIRLKDQDYEKIDLPKLEKASDEKAVLIATKELTNERWTPFDPGQLIVFKNGGIIYPRTERDTGPSSTPPQGMESKVLSRILKSPHRISVREICQSMPKAEITPVLRSLLSRGLIKQDSRDRVFWDHDDATYYTNRDKRDEIDRLIGKRS